MKPTIVTITGPSCAGKTTLETQLKTLGFLSATSTTTRKRRPGEIDGEAYHFVSEHRFREMEKANQLIESVDFGGNGYGVTVAEVERVSRQGKPITLVCEPVGQKQIAEFCKKNSFNLVSVFVSGTDRQIAERFLLRFVGDTSEKALAAGVTRLKEMLTTERRWIAEAYANPNLYDLLIPEFNQYNELDVIRDIVAMTTVRMSSAA